MRVLLTGATGYVGSAVAEALLSGKHPVTGLARSESKAKALIERGMKFVVADLSDHARLSSLAAEHEAIIHCGSSDTGDRAQIERGAALSLIEGGKRGKAKVFLFTSGVWVFGNTGPNWVDERSPTTSPFFLSAHRPAIEKEVLDAGTSSFRTNVVRPGIVYGESRGIVSIWIADAVAGKPVRVVGDGTNAWPFVHREDLGALYRLVLEKGASRGIYHGTDDQAPKTLEVAKALAKAAGNVPVNLWPLDEAKKVMGPFAEALALDQRVKSSASRQLGWKPTHRDIVSEAERVVADYRSYLRSAASFSR